MARMAGIKKVFSQEELEEFKTYRMKIWCVCESVCERERMGIKALKKRKPRVKE